MDVGSGVILTVVLLIIFTSLRNVTAPVQPSAGVTPPAYWQLSEQEREVEPQLIRHYIYKNVGHRLDEKIISFMADCIVRFGTEFKVDPVFVTALIKRESGFIPDKVSPSGAVGLGQVKPVTARGLGVNDLFDIEQNVKTTIWYLRKMLDLWNGYENQIKLALASYKEGYGTIKRSAGRYSAQTAGYIEDIFTYYKWIKLLR
jgi:hypothetical protein